MGESHRFEAAVGQQRQFMLAGSHGSESVNSKPLIPREFVKSTNSPEPYSQASRKNLCSKQKTYLSHPPRSIDTPLYPQIRRRVLRPSLFVFGRIRREERRRPLKFSGHDGLNPGVFNKTFPKSR